jgi:exopolysaccharide biosynthesis protein
MFPALALLAAWLPISVDIEPVLTPRAAVRPSAATALPGRILAPGIEFFQEVGTAPDNERPLAFCYLRIDPKAPGIRIEAALAQDRVWGNDPTKGRETVSRLAKRRGAVAAINGGYFGAGGDPVGLHIGDGELRSEPLLNRSVLMLGHDGAADIATFSMKATVRSEDREWTLNGVNRPPVDTRQLLAYNARFHTSTHPAPGRFEMVIDTSGNSLRHGKTIGQVVQTTVGGATTIPNDGVVLSAGGTLADEMRSKIKAGDRLEIDIQLISGSPTRFAPDSIRHAIAGAPRIVTDGKPDIRVAPEDVKPDVAHGRSPRTAAGICRDGSLILLTIDGRQETLSQGATLEELANLMIGLGAVDAVNLDGGGSTTMVVDGAVVNAPSADGVERPIADALLVFADGIADGPLQELPLPVPGKPVRVGDQVAIPLPDGFSPETTVWGSTGGSGFVDQSGVFRALRGGKATVQAKDRGRIARGVVEVAADPQRAGQAAASFRRGSTRNRTQVSQRNSRR